MIKDFDCVEMKRKGARKVQRAISGLTRDQEIAFWRKKTQMLKKSQKAKTK